MAQIIDIGVETLEKFPTILHFIQEAFGYDHPVKLYAVDGDNSGFVIKDDLYCIFVVNKEKLEAVEFTLNEDNSIDRILKDNYIISYSHNDMTIYTDLDKGIEMNLVYDKYEGKDLEGYDGCFVFNQYRVATDKRCEMHYPHMYRINSNNGQPQIYSFNLHEPQAVFIDSKYVEKGPNGYGLIRKDSKYLHKITVYNGDPDYDVIALREYGLVNFLQNNSYSLLKEDKIKRYCTIKLLLPPDKAYTFFPIGEMYREEEVKQYLSSENFLTEIPDFVIRDYNGQDTLVNDIKEIATQIAIVEHEKEGNRRMTLILKEE